MKAGRHRDLFWQLVRYGVNGALTTGLYTMVFVALDTLTPASVQLCNLAGYLVALGFGYVLHSRVTFRAHGARGRGAQLRFVVASVPAYALNAFWAWLLLHRLALPHWTVQVPIWAVTPLMVFALNRWWVFR